MIAGILLFGFSDRNSGDIWSLLSKLTRCTSYGSPVSSRKIDTLTPLGVGSEYSCSRSGCCAGHLRLIRKSDRDDAVTRAILPWVGFAAFCRPPHIGAATRRKTLRHAPANGVRCQRAEPRGASST